VEGDLTCPEREEADPRLGLAADPKERVAIALVDTDPTVRTVLVDHLQKLGVMAVAHDDLQGLLEGPDHSAPAVVVVGPSEDPETSLPKVEELLRRRSSYGAVLLVFELSPEIVQRAFRSGVDDVVAIHAEDSELLAAVGRATARVLRRLEEAEKEALIAAAVPAAIGVGTTRAGRIITVFGSKGGVGKSVLSTNLAVALAQVSEGPVALVDANLQFGDDAVMLQLHPTHTITEAVMAGDRLDIDLLDDLLLRHEPTGVLVLAAPTEPASADQIQRSDLINILSVLREMCDYVVVDTSPHLSDGTLVALELADEIVMVSSLDVMSLKNSRVSLQALQVLGVPFSKIKFVVNRHNASGPLAPADAERTVQMKADVVLPREELVAESVTHGVPLVSAAPTSKFAKAVTELARSLAKPAERAPRVGVAPQARPSSSGEVGAGSPEPLAPVPVPGHDEAAEHRRRWPLARRARVREPAPA
jgi:pilus assembly protein CpaE